ncbi:tyrosine-type recombinase/integrase [Lawsonia intracellularis]|uniref:Integrase n=1 Tax=Lawsonia intracellularis (strain PHE/MN1-00) TaxID=363253 RepID=Q1MP33_LAWIP|nr:site-specific integrase [Lawsonia intracellularis]AGC50621.1 integrase [Lawsonia intracellularis N343]KAA0204240.1 site-specific integrase [Lawsonia intracellularis]MBZ3893367.1 tyrosine-type recombinase/integrase [Lawsonia intracellularis]OMQ02021.1 integrase [Lawsonia intracellularis]RBN31827.1 site-specific integrase [Lawsonia intracellularis]
MAIRKRNLKSKNAISYQVYWNNPYTGLREAKTFPTLFEASAFESLIKHRLKYEKTFFKPKENTTLEPVTLYDAVLCYLQKKKFTPQYTKIISCSLQSILTSYGDVKLSELKTDFFVHLKNYLETKTKKNGECFSRSYIHIQLSRLRTILNWAYEQGMLVMLPKMKLGDPYYTRTIPPTFDEITRLIAVSPPHLVRIIILGAAFGLRVGPSELFSLTWDKIDLKSGVVRISTSKKNPRFPWREVPIKDELKPFFSTWFEEDTKNGLSYVITYKGKPIRSIHSSWSKALKNAGITRRIRPYDLRHSFASELISSGVDVGTVAQLLNHSSPNMLFKYYQYVETKQKKRAIELLPSVSCDITM